jgi:hypothetical protein
LSTSAALAQVSIEGSRPRSSPSDGIDADEIPVGTRAAMVLAE